MTRLRVALVQVAADQDVAANVDRAAALVRTAGESKPGLIALPEMFQYRGPLAGFRESATPLPGPITEPFSELARELNAWILLGSLAAYALVRIPFRFNRAIQIGILGTRMIPEVSLIIPLFIVASSLDLINKPIVLIIAYMSFALTYAIWMMIAFFQTVPTELEEAARLDGCTRLGILWRVVMPISVPGLISTAMFIFLVAWDEFFYALIFTSTLAAKTVPVAIAEFIGRYAININGMMAGGILAALPPVILGLIFQRYIVSGMTAGAVKG